MQLRPVPGWRLSVTDLGMPDDTLISTRPAAGLSQSFVGNIGERAFFLASSGEPGALDWWVAGVNVQHGQPLFPAIQLTSAYNPDCFLNGPDALLCITSELERRTAWVIDTHSGDVTYSGPTDLDVRPSELTVQQVGVYAVAESVDEGVYGVGPKAETTWFVPGAGDATPKDPGELDIDVPQLAYQTVDGFGAFGKTLFSLTDGRVIKPELPPGTEITKILLYSGGFAATVAHHDGRDETMLFDDIGRRTTHRDFGRSSLPSQTHILDLPSIGQDGGWGVYTPGGGLVLKIPGSPTRLVGSRLIVGAHDFSTRGWDQYDIRTGEKGKRCTNLDMAGGYIGYDGSRIAVSADRNDGDGLDTEATDLDTCERLWVISSPFGSFRHVWRINTTLVQLSDDGTELMSLVAPHE